jgi:hypothetical protein
MFVEPAATCPLLAASTVFPAVIVSAAVTFTTPLNLTDTFSPITAFIAVD